MSVSLHTQLQKQEGEQFAQLVPLHSDSITASNAQEILNGLGVPYIVDETGTRPLDELIEGCLVWLNSHKEDNAIPEFQDGNVIYCERRAGYLHDRISRIYEQAVSAKKRGAVTYGFF